ncbi:shikimate dehydrogenase family protein [Neisseria animalis]|uniref:Shikimate dehydrogenase n=1 Tax=Neisseria animalis TaxID=492 RepID=A0A5P3MT45_NEIAN|nr:shikimate dehydrogenase [Neisseria animalis]QEY24630.1 shikimate dehydrogenase [Neisseria animalis]ROW32957.1 shikimate dehydrogenase [Neisseria animalis]VEE07518.1 shikimate 5-dehydrogenase [Neisseria animalis]
MNIDGNTRVIAHIGYPTHTFKSPMIYNPYFEHASINALVVPFSSQAPVYPDFLRSVFTCDNVIGALVTMPHKVTTTALADRLTPTAQIAGSCNAVRRGADGKLEGDMFDGEGFVRGVRRKGFAPEGKSALVVGSGGVGSAIAASLAAAGVARLALFDVNTAAAESLAGRLKQHYPALTVETGGNDPAGFDLVVNATPLGMYEGDPMPVDVGRIAPSTFVGEVVLKSATTAFLAAAQAKGCPTQIGTDMLFEQIPVYLEYFGLPATTAEHLREVARIEY